MSITQARHFFEKWGCGTIVGVALGVVLIGGLFVGRCDQFGGGGNPQERPKTVVAEVDKNPVFLEDIADTYSRAVQTLAASPSGISPDIHAGYLSGVISNQIQSAVMRVLAAKHGVTASATDVEAETRRQIEMTVENEVNKSKQQLIQLKRIKADASEADFAKAFQEMFGTDLAAEKTRMMDTLTEAYKDDAQKKQMELQLLSLRVLESLKAKISISDDELKKTYNTYVTKRIFLQPTMENNRMEEMLKIEAEVKAGKSSFEDLMKKHTDDPKKDSTIDYDAAILDFDVTLEPIKALKVGEASGIINTSSGPAIYKVVTIQPKVPKEFDKVKEARRTEVVEKRATRQLYNESRAIIESGKVVWKSTACQTLFEASSMNSDSKLVVDPPALKARLKELYEKSKSLTDAVAGKELSDMARYAAYVAYRSKLTKSEQQAARATQLEELSLVVGIDNNIDTRLDVASLAMDERNATLAYENLLVAMESNLEVTDIAEARFKKSLELKQRIVTLKLVDADKSSKLDAATDKWKQSVYEALTDQATYNVDYTATGQSTWSDINAKITKYEKEGYLSADQVGKLRLLQEKWKTDRAAYDKEQAKLQADAEKAAAEAAKRDKEAEKKAGTTGAAPTTGTTGGSPLTTGTTTGG